MAHMNAMTTRLKQARESAGLLQKQVADHFGRPQQWLSYIESGRAQSLSPEIVAGMADLYGVSPAYLYFGCKDSAKPAQLLPGHEGGPPAKPVSQSGLEPGQPGSFLKQSGGRQNG